MALPIKQLAAAIQACGMSAKVVLSDDESLDDEIEVTPLVSVQVGHNRSGGYAIVNAWTSPEMDEMQHFKTRKISDTAGVIADIRKACGFVS